jgi:hypothetical protein
MQKLSVEDVLKILKHAIQNDSNILLMESSQLLEEVKSYDVPK